MKRVCVNLSDEQAAALKERARETGVPQSEQIRRAINLATFADQQVVRKYRPAQQPVLTYRKESENATR